MAKGIWSAARCYIVALGVTATSAWYLDPSCGDSVNGRDYQTLVTTNMASAFTLAQAGLQSMEALGNSQGNAQQQALQRYLFFQSIDTAQFANIIRGVYTDVLAFGGNAPTRMPANPSPANLPSDGVVVYCDYSRFRENWNGTQIVPGMAYDQHTQETMPMDATYTGCRDSTNFDTTQAWTVNNNRDKVSQIQMCRWYLQYFTAGEKLMCITCLPNPGVKGFFAKAFENIESLLGTRVPMDAAALIDHTLLHEMTHAINNNVATDAGGRNLAYGWNNCKKLSPFGRGASRYGGGWNNADSYAYFGLGSYLITQGVAANEDGSIGTIPVAGNSKAKRAIGLQKGDMAPATTGVVPNPPLSGSNNRDSSVTNHLNVLAAVADTSALSGLSAASVMTESPQETAFFETYDWDGDETWNKDQQAFLSSLAAESGPFLTWHGDDSAEGSGTSAVASSTVRPVTAGPATTGAAIRFSSTPSNPSTTAAPLSIVPTSSVPLPLIPSTTAAPLNVVPTSSVPLPPANNPPPSSGRLNTTVQCDLNKVLVGDITQYSLNSSVIKAMTPLCSANGVASGTQCETNEAVIPGVNYFNGDSENGLGTGALTLTIQNSNYTSSAQATAMIALVANGLASTATGSNCAAHTYEQDCRPPDRLRSRHEPDGGGGGGFTPVCEEHNITVCQASNNIYVSVNDAAVFPSQVAFMNVQFTFDYDDGSVFSCEEVLDALLAIADWAVPEAVPEDPEILGAILAFCQAINGEDPSDPATRKERSLDENLLDG